MILAVSCLCGGSENLIRGRLREYGYRDYLKIKIHKGREKSLSVLGTIPPYPEVQLLKNYIESHSKYAVIVGCNEEKCRWADLGSPNPKEYIEAELIVKHFA